MEIRLPNINAQTDKEQLEQIRRYLYSLAQELNWGLSQIEKNSFSIDKESAIKQAVKASIGEVKQTPQSAFNDIKALIIKSADIVNAYYEEINRRLVGVYVAESLTGKYKEETEAKISANSREISAVFSNTQEINSKVSALEGVIQNDGSTTTIRSTDAWVKIGALATKDTGHYLYGMEIGQTDYTNNVQVLRKYARYTSEGVYLYDGTAENDDDWSLRISRGTIEVKEIKLNNLRIGNTVIELQTDGSIVEKWSPL